MHTHKKNELKYATDKTSVLVCTHFGPVFTIADVVEIPTGGEEGLEASLGDVVHFLRPIVPTLPYVDHCIGQDRQPIVKYLLPHHILLPYGLDQIQQPTKMYWGIVEN